MILNFSIENFGPFRDKQTLSFEPARDKKLEEYYLVKKGKFKILKLGLIYGANASGKTYLLKGLDFLRQLILEPATIKTEKLHFKPFLFDLSHKEKPSSLAIEFVQKNIKYAYFVKFNEDSIIHETLYQYKHKKALVFERKNTKESDFILKFGSTVKISSSNEKAIKNNTLRNNTVLGGYLKTNVTVEPLEETINWFERLHPVIYSKTELNKWVLSQIKEGNINKEDIIQLLKAADFNIHDFDFNKELFPSPEILEKFSDLSIQIDMSDSLKSIFQLIFPDDYRDIFLPDDLKFIHLVKNKTFSLTYDQESEGTLRYFGLAGILALMIKNKAIFSIDELESSLHPDLFEHFLITFLYHSKESQLIATTHLREIMAQTDLIRDDILWITDKSNENAATELYSLADFDTKKLRKNYNRYNLYKAGRFGGIPKTQEPPVIFSKKKTHE